MRSTSTGPVTILAIESSCDETSCAISRDGIILSNIIAGQGTVALEMLDDAPDLDVLIVLIGPEPGSRVTGYRYTENRACRGLRLHFRVFP